MKELMVIVAFNTDGKILSIEPKNKVDGKVAYYSPMTARLLTPNDIDREIKQIRQCMCKGEIDISKCR